jgi:hypothetical protein
MKAADLNRFLVLCALVSDLYCPGYNRAQSLEKTSNLVCTAIRYKVDPAKLAADARAELSKTKTSAPKQSASKLMTGKSPYHKRSK